MSKKKRVNYNGGYNTTTLTCEECDKVYIEVQPIDFKTPKWLEEQIEIDGEYENIDKHTCSSLKLTDNPTAEQVKWYWDTHHIKSAELKEDNFGGQLIFKASKKNVNGEGSEFVIGGGCSKSLERMKKYFRKLGKNSITREELGKEKRQRKVWTFKCSACHQQFKASSDNETEARKLVDKAFKEHQKKVHGGSRDLGELEVPADNMIISQLAGINTWLERCKKCATYIVNHQGSGEGLNEEDYQLKQEPHNCFDISDFDLDQGNFSSEIYQKYLVNLSNHSKNSWGSYEEIKLINEEKLLVKRIGLDSYEININDYSEEEGKKHWIRIRNYLKRQQGRPFSNPGKEEIKSPSAILDNIKEKRDKIKEKDQEIKNNQGNSNQPLKEEIERLKSELEELKKHQLTSIMEWFKKNKVKRVILRDDGKLEIEYKENGERDIVSISNSQLLVIKDYLKSENKKELSEKELMDKINSSSNEKKFPYWIFFPISLVIVATIAGIFIYRKRKKIK